MAKVAKVEYRPKWNHTRGPATKQLCMSRYDEHVQLKIMSKGVDVAIAKDFADHAVIKGKELVEAAINNDAHAISVILNSYKKAVPMFQERLINDDGNFAQSSTEERGIVENHFCRLLKGIHEALKAVLVRERQEAVQWAASHADVVRCIESIPALQEVTSRHASAKASKGIGEGCLGPDAHKCYPEAIGRLMHPVHVKSCVFISRPLQFRGGQLQELWKKKKARSQITSFREVLLCDEDAKVLGGHNRQVSFPCVREMVSEAAMGSGLNSGSCDAGQLVISEALAAAMKMNQCGYVIFTDVSTAFASLHRNLALMTDADTDEVWARHLERCCFFRCPSQRYYIYGVRCFVVGRSGVISACF